MSVDIRFLVFISDIFQRYYLPDNRSLNNICLF